MTETPQGIVNIPEGHTPDAGNHTPWAGRSTSRCEVARIVVFGHLTCDDDPLMHQREHRGTHQLGQVSGRWFPEPAPHLDLELGERRTGPDGLPDDQSEG